MAELIETLESGKFDVVLIDTGPLLGSLEANLVSSHADGVVLVVSKNQSDVQARSIIDSQDSVRSEVDCLGLVYNRATEADIARSSSVHEQRTLDESQRIQAAPGTRVRSSPSCQHRTRMHKLEATPNGVGLLDPRGVSESLRDGPAPLVWGADAIELHDRMWASRRIQVVRPGAMQRPDSKVELFLLVRSGELLVFDPDKAVTKIRWVQPPAVRIRVSDTHHDAYAERTESDADGAFLRIIRIYAAETYATSQAWLTARRDVAQAWASAVDTSAATAAVKKLCGEQKCVMSVKGSVIGATNVGATSELHEELLRHWRNPGRVFDGTFQYQPGVWVHETSQIDDDAHFVPPVWVGAHASVSGDDLCVGPLVVEDATPLPPPRRIAWGEMTAPDWQLLPPLGQRPGARAFKRVFDVVFSAVRAPGDLLALSDHHACHHARRRLARLLRARAPDHRWSRVPLLQVQDDAQGRRALEGRAGRQEPGRRASVLH